MSIVRIKAPDRLSGQTAVIESKSMGHRLLIAAFLSGIDITVNNEAEDIRATKECLAALGQSQQPLLLPCRESGSTLRFLLPLAAALGKTVTFQMEGRLQDRPLDDLRTVMEEHGAKLDKDGQELTVSGQLCGGVYRLPGHVSSQYVTGLLFALPLLAQDSRIEISQRLESEPYVRMTLAVLRLAGIEIRETKRATCFEIPGGQWYRLAKDIAVEEDWSNHAVWLVMGAIADAPIVNIAMNLHSTQGDRQICEIIRRFGGRILTRQPEVQTDEHREQPEAQTDEYCEQPEAQTDEYCVQVDRAVDLWAEPGELRGIEIDASQTPDLVPMLAVLAAAAQGQTRICRAGRLRLKESDRLEAIGSVLSRLGAEVCVTEDGLFIRGQKGRYLHGGRVSAFGDHRIVMMAAAASLLTHEAIEIEGAEAVSKSYPHFFAQCRQFGFMIIEEE